ncbi:hypothetical protein EON65_28590 [archaeon]|nr:MAG: hypothetical protein EON65_28590 [archaeon]
MLTYIYVSTYILVLHCVLAIVCIVVLLMSLFICFNVIIVSLGIEYYHWLAEAMKHTFAMRMFLGDPDYNVTATTTAAFNALLDDVYMSSLAKMSSSDHALDLSMYGGVYNTTHYIQEDHGTSHVSVIDQYGNTVALTTTANTEFGSKVISNSTGLLFNNQMDDFSIPNVTNYFGLFPSPYNYPEPKKKPLSSMSPSILLDKKGRVVLVGGASGGPRIITGTAQVISILI